MKKCVNLTVYSRCMSGAGLTVWKYFLRMWPEMPPSCHNHITQTEKHSAGGG